MKFPEITLNKILGLLLLCFVVGFVLTSLGIQPRDFWYFIVYFVEWVFGLITSSFKDGLTYLLVGAAVVIPIYAVLYLMRAWRKKP